MNTLPRAVTAQFFPTTDSYNALRKQWSDLMNSERRQGLSAAQHLLYLALIGKDWRKAFTPPTNRRKLENGAFSGWEFFRAIEQVHSRYTQTELLAVFDGLVTPEMLVALRSWLPYRQVHGWGPQGFARGAFAFQAFYPPEASPLSSTARDGHA